MRYDRKRNKGLGAQSPSASLRLARCLRENKFASGVFALAQEKLYYSQ